MTRPLFHGVIPPVSTILNENEQLDRQGMARLIDFAIEGGVNGLFFLGSAGEFAHMSRELRHEVAEFCTKHVAGRVPVLIGAAHPGTAETLAFARHARSVGADGVVVVNPYYNPITEEALYLHYKTIAENAGLPVVMYNYPGLTGQSIPVNLIKRLALDCPNIVGLKDTVDSLNHIRETLAAVKPVRPDFAVFSGYDEYLFGTLTSAVTVLFPPARTLRHSSPAVFTVRLKRKISRPPLSCNNVCHSCRRCIRWIRRFTTSSNTPSRRPASKCLFIR